MRACLVVLALITLTVGCGSSTNPSQGGASDPGTIEALWKKSGESVALVPGTSDYSPGDVRVSFLVVNSQARVIAPPRADVWVARAMNSHPFAHTIATREKVGVPGIPGVGAPNVIYVAHVPISTPGNYYLLARPIGPVHIGAIQSLPVKNRSQSPEVGDRAPASRTPTIASTGGNFARLTTRVPPDRALLRYSVADSLAAHAPFVVTFATPRWCQSRTCGPAVDVVDYVRRHSVGTPIRFIHVEVYRGNNPRKGWSRWMRQWHLTTEPWTFLVGRDGRIKARFEGAVSARELQSAVNRFLR
ncbi:MAG TPA: hypothetical protein VIZ44_06705 [Gaiellaceae bacterium]